MRRAIHISALVVLCFGVLRAVEREAPRSPHFEPVEVLSTVEATYPITSVTWGTVILRVTVGKSGEIQDIKVIRDLPPFTQAAEQALRQWKFRPATLDGKPVTAPMMVAFSFNPPPLRK